MCPVLDPSLMRGYNSIRECGNVEHTRRGIAESAAFRFFFFFLSLPVAGTSIYTPDLSRQRSEIGYRKNGIYGRVIGFSFGQMIARYGLGDAN